MDFWVYSEVKGKAICLVHGEQIAVFKDYSLNCHYNTKHSEKYKNLLCFTHSEREHPIPTCDLFKNGKVSHSLRGSLSKSIWWTSTVLICPVKREAFENVPLSRWNNKMDQEHYRKFGVLAALLEEDESENDDIDYQVVQPR